MDDVTLRIGAEVSDALDKVRALRESYLDFTTEWARATQMVSALVNKLTGDDIFRQAQAWSQIVERVGGVSKLTASEQDQLNKILTEAILKYQALGLQAPAALNNLKLATDRDTEATKLAAKEAKAFADLVSQMLGTKVIGQANDYAKAIQNIGGVTKLTESEQKKVNDLMVEALAKYKALGQEAPAALVKIEQETRKAEGAQKNLSDTTGKGVSEMQKSFDQFFVKMTGAATLGGVFGNILIGAFRNIDNAIKSTVGWLADLAVKGSDVQNISQSFEKLAAGIGHIGGGVIAKARESSRGLITDFDLMTSANRAMLFGLKTTPEQFGLLTESSIKLSRAMGIDSTKALNDLVTALGRVSPRILDNLGIIVKVTEANKKWADAHHMRKEEMTASQRVEAFETEALGKIAEHVKNLGELNLTLADRMRIVKVSIENFTNSLGLALNQSPVLRKMFESIGEALNYAFGTNRQDSINTTVHVIEQIAITLVSTAAAAAKFASVAWESFGYVKEAAYTTITGVFALSEKFLGLGEIVAKVASYMPGAGPEWKLAIATMQIMRADIDKTAKSWVQSAIDAHKMATGTDAVGNALSKTTDVLRAMAEEMIFADEIRVKSSKTDAIIIRNKGEENQLSGQELAVQRQLQSQRDATSKQLLQLNEVLGGAYRLHLSNATIAGEYGNKLHDLTLKAKELGIALPENIKKGMESIRLDFWEQTYAKLYGGLETLSKQFITAVKGATEEASTETLKNLDANYKLTEKNELDILKLQRKNYEDSLEFKLKVIEQEAEKRREAVKKNEVNTQAALDQITKWEQAAANAATMAWEEHTLYSKQEIRGFQKAYEDIIDNIPKYVRKAFESGDIGKALRGFTSEAGSSLGEALFNSDMLAPVMGKFVDGVGKLFGGGTLGQKIGGALANSIPGIGAAVGSLLAPLAAKVTGMIKGLFSTAGRDSIVDFANTFKGGFDGPEGLHAKLLEIGDAGEDMWKRLSSVGRGDKAGAEKAIKDATTMIDTFAAQIKKRNEENNAHLKGLLDVGQKWRELPDDIKPYIDQLEKAGLLTKENAELLRGLGSEANTDYKHMQALAEEYGISIDALGPKFQQQKLTETATGIINAFEELIDGGADYGGVLAGMKDEIGHVVQESIKFGTVIPGNMKPWIEELFNSGKLLDDNGDKITDISSLQFGENIKKGLDDVVLKLQEMIDLLKNQLPGALGNSGDKLNENQRQWDEWGKHAKERIAEVREGVDGVTYGSSPGGLKEWVPKLSEARRHFAKWGDDASSAISRVRRGVDELGLGTDMGDLALAGPAGAVGGGGSVIENHIHIHGLDGTELGNFVERVGQDSLNERRWKVPGDVVLDIGQRPY